MSAISGRTYSPTPQECVFLFLSNACVLCCCIFSHGFLLSLLCPHKTFLLALTSVIFRRRFGAHFPQQWVAEGLLPFGDSDHECWLVEQRERERKKGPTTTGLPLKISDLWRNAGAGPNGSGGHSALFAFCRQSQSPPRHNCTYCCCNVLSGSVIKFNPPTWWPREDQLAPPPPLHSAVVEGMEISQSRRSHPFSPLNDAAALRST